MKEREDRYRRIRQRARDRGIEAEADWIRVGSSVPAVAGAVMAAAKAGTDDGSKPAVSPLAAKAAMYQRSHPPRPRKTKKR